MSGCCDPSSYDGTFNERFAHRSARRYRRKGLDGVSRRVLDRCLEAGVEGATVLEIGGGVGQLHVELLRHGAASATNLELAHTYEADAAALLADEGLTDRVQRRFLDLAAEPEAVEPADVVVLNRVVCCYPDDVALLSAAASRTRRLLVLSYPRPNVAVRAVLKTQNIVWGMLGSSFKAFAHPVRPMLDALAAHGLTSVRTDPGTVWQVTAVTRS